MKIAVLNDTHWGARNDSPAFINYFNRFYDEVFFPYLQENNINTIVHLGDVVDRRKFINHNTAHNFKLKFWDRIEQLKLNTHVLLGNHDTYYKNTNTVNALQNLSVPNTVKIYTSHDTVSFEGLDILFLPWICDELIESTLHAIDNSTAQIVMGHLEIKGFEMHKGHLNEQGLDKSLFKRFEKVISGHFHKKSDDGHIYYLGNPYELTWQDYKDPRGFHLFDLDSRGLEFIPNPYVMFERVEYDDKEGEPTDLDTFDLKDCYVKLVVVNKTDYYKFDKFIQKLYTKGCADIKIIEDLSEFEDSEVGEEINLEDTLSVLSNYIDSVETDVDKEQVKTFMRTLYTEAVNVEVV
mgnify:CR=1 FL=1